MVCGSMFSGKTEELIRRLKRAGFAHQKIEIFKPAIDVRYDTVRVVSHDEKAVNSTPVQTASEILLHVSDAEVVGIDDAQFFGEDLAEVCTLLANPRDYSGLGYGFRGQAVRPYATVDGYRRVGDESARGLCEMRQSRTILAPFFGQQEFGAAGRNRFLRTSVPAVLSGGHRPNRERIRLLYYSGI